MPNSPSAEKALRQSRKRTLRNAKVKHQIKDLLKKAKKTITAKKQGEAQEFLREVQRALDKAAQKGIIKKNTAARKKSRLAASFKKMLVAMNEK